MRYELQHQHHQLAAVPPPSDRPTEQKRSTMHPQDALLAFYRRCLGPGKKPTLAHARHFAEHISAYTDFHVRYKGMTTVEAAAIIAEAQQILENC